ncbi:MAG: polysaccharide deacetylase family protein [Planctomycetes bacterium]|nr:polysaccharide deacetylase family protein [Planctomycetota bacterium]
MTYTTIAKLALTILLLPAVVGVAAPALARERPAERLVRDKYGAISRGDVTAKKLALVFTGDERGESTSAILDTLRARKIQAGLFVTGSFVRDAKLQPLLRRAIAEGHYLGPHSDSHPLYCPWEDREKSLVTQEVFASDLSKNLAGLETLGTLRGKMPRLFVPPYECYNADQVRWSAALGVTLINFTPGSGSNRDYAPEGDRRFVPSRQIYDDILAYERKNPHGLNGFILLLHLGSGRQDPFHPMLGPLCDELVKRGYGFVRIDRLLQMSGVEQ